MSTKKKKLVKIIIITFIWASAGSISEDSNNFQALIFLIWSILSILIVFPWIFEDDLIAIRDYFKWK